MIRPGPERIVPGLASGGIVLHVYRLSGSLILERRLPASVVLGNGDTIIEETATADALEAARRTADGEPIVVVVYDGDDGERYPADEDMREELRDAGSVFVCPRCNAMSAHPMDIAQGYCGQCHDWTGGVDESQVP